MSAASYDVGLISICQIERGGIDCLLNLVTRKDIDPGAGTGYAKRSLRLENYVDLSKQLDIQTVFCDLRAMEDHCGAHSELLVTDGESVSIL